MRTLFLITARGGSKGIPRKNIKLLAGKPLIHYSIEYARLFAEDKDICLSTDSEEISKVASQIGYKTQFIRPAHLAEDNSGSYEVIVHAVNYYKELGIEYDNVILLQPTSPLRLKKHLDEALALYSNDVDMIVSVVETQLYHYYEEKEGSLFPYEKIYTRRQDAPILYQHNGSFYIINCNSLLKYNSFKDFKKVKKFVLDKQFSVDIDSDFDFLLVEFFVNHFNKL